MGQILNANCRICNFETDFRYGGGQLNYRENCPVPAINKETGHFETVNYITEKNNTQYLFYTDKQLKGDNGNNSIYQNFNLELNQTNNLCPNCKQYSFDFAINMFY
jgi:hypothetical protein